MRHPQGLANQLHIFLCHSSGDKLAVRSLYNQLCADGFDPWLDEERLLPGQDWHQEIEKAVRNSDVVVVCLSHDSINKTGYIQKEIKYALDIADEQPEGTIYLIPLKLEECETPERLRRWHWVNFFEDRGYKRLLLALQARAGELGIDQGTVSGFQKAILLSENKVHYASESFKSNENIEEKLAVDSSVEPGEQKASASIFKRVFFDFHSHNKIKSIILFCLIVSTIAGVIMIYQARHAAQSIVEPSNNITGDIAARVGTREITLRQVDIALKLQANSTTPDFNSFTDEMLSAARLNVLNNLIQEEALFQKAEKDNLVADEITVTNEIQARRKAAGFTEEEYQKRLNELGLTEEEFRETIRRELALNSLKERLSSRVKEPSDAEIEKYFESHKTEFTYERGVDLAIIVTDPANNSMTEDAIGDTAAETKIREIYQQLKRGADFATVASQRSEDSSTSTRNGNVGFASEEKLRDEVFPTRPDLSPKLMSMDIKQFTEPIQDRVSKNWYIIRINDKHEKSGAFELKEVREQIISAIKTERQQILLDTLTTRTLNELRIQNYLAEQVSNTQTN